MTTTTGELTLVARIGASLIAANAPSNSAERYATRLIKHFGIPAQVAMLPNSVLTIEDEDGHVEFGRAKPGSFRFDQTDALFKLVDDLLDGKVNAKHASNRLDAIEKAPPSVGMGVRYLGYLLIIAGLSLNQRPTVATFLATVAIGLVIALVLVTTPKWGKLALIAPIAAAFLSTVGISLAVQAGFATEPVKMLIPLLASLIPGAALSIASLELTQGAIVSGSSRFTMALHQLVVLTLGVVLALSLLPQMSPESLQPGGSILSWWFRPVGVLLYSIGAWLAFSAPRGALPSLVVVLVGAWGVQQLALLGVGAYTAGLIAGFAGVLIAVAVRQFFGGAPSLLTLNPIFRIIAPGGLGLVTVVHVGMGDWYGPDLGTVVFQFLSVALGMTIGVALAEWLAPRLKQKSSLGI